jgi:hypothetical protein
VVIMTHSKTHKRFSERLNNPDALKNPANYLGPNWEDVLNFWIYLDTLSDQEKEAIADRYYALDYNARYWASIDALNAAEEVVGEDFRHAAWWAAYDVTEWTIFGVATCELISHHKLIEQNKTPLALQYCTKS